MNADQRTPSVSNISDVSHGGISDEDQEASPIVDQQHRHSIDTDIAADVPLAERESSEVAMEGRDDTPVTSNLPELEREKPPSSVESWPQGPQHLGKLSAWQIVCLSIDLLASLLPIFFIVLSIAALSLDGTSKSRLGENIIEASKYGTTAFPFVFGAVIGRLLKAIALWRCEYGVRLGVLEQLAGSQSLVTTVERFIQLRQYDFVAFALLLLWAFSPFGSQMTLRLLSLVDSEVIGTKDITYFNISTDGTRGVDVGSAFESASGLQSFYSALVTLIGTSMLASEAVLQSPVDQWGSVKIPYLESIPSDGVWATISNTTPKKWTSLSGIMTIDLPPNQNSSFVIKTAYIDAECADPVSIPLDFSKGLDLKSAGFGLVVNNNSSPWMQSVPGMSIEYENLKWNSNFLDILNSSRAWEPLLPKNLIYGSIISSNYFEDGPHTLEIFNCSIEFPRIDANVSCQGRSCAVTHLRRSNDDGGLHYDPLMGFTAYFSMLATIPTALGFPHAGDPSAIDQYVLGADNPFTVGLRPVKPGFHDIHGSFVAKRLMTLLNTVWQASMCPLAIGLGPNANLTSCLAHPGGPESDRAAKTTASTRRTIPQSRYKTTIWHAAILLFISILLQTAGIVTITIMTLTKAPNLLGYVSTLIKDNPFVAVPPGGSTLDGPDRANYLAHTKVRIADVRPEEDVGYLAFCSEGNEHGQGFRRLQKGRLYA